MIEVVAVAEGRTEQTFVRDVLAPSLTDFGVLLEPRPIKTSEHGRGGGLTRERVVRFLRNTLRQRGDTYVTTLFDLYGLLRDFPGVKDGSGVRDPRQRCRLVEDALVEEVVAASGCRADRFLPHVQPFEFEALLFSDVTAFAVVEPVWQPFVSVLQSARDGAATPEHINDGRDTHPSIRLESVLTDPRYKKPLHGSLIASEIGLPRIRGECPHFNDWLTRLESLQPLR